MDDNTTAISATRRSYKELVDGTLRVQFDIDPMYKRDFLKLFPDIDTPAAIAPLQTTQPVNASYGNYARILHGSRFLVDPAVLQHLGSDANYRAWIQDQSCIVCGKQDYVEDSGQLKCEAAHVRRADRFGMGYKAEYACVSLCRKHHGLQHLKGEDFIGGAHFVDKEHQRQLRGWAWQALKQQLGVDSMKQAAPQDVRDWAEQHGVADYLP